MTSKKEIIGDLRFKQTGDDWDQAARKTYVGMAHFAGTGPAGKTCRTCTHFAPAFKGRSRNRVCHRFKELTGKWGDSIPAKALACKHYEEKQ